MLIYVHVPFCRSKCRYCAFYSEVPAPGAFEAYAEALLREIDLHAGELGSRPVETIFFGGGTPSLLPAPLLGRILEALASRFALASYAKEAQEVEHFAFENARLPQSGNPLADSFTSSFDLWFYGQFQKGIAVEHSQRDSALEVGLEANPESLAAPGRAAELKALGITRLSIGAQSFDNARLRLIGRPHTALGVENAVRSAQQAGFSNIGLDLIRGLPGANRLAAHTRKSWLRELQRAVSFAPQHISTYCLTLEPGTPLAEVTGLRFPAESVQAAMYHEGAAFLESEGFPQYEVSNFSRPGFTCRHNQGYWRGADYLGLGPGAVSTLTNVRRTNPPDFALWRAACLNGDVSAFETETLSQEILALERLMLGLRTVEGVDIPAWEALSGRSFTSTYGVLTRALAAAGLVTASPGRLAPTRQGLAVADAIVERFVEEER